MKITSDKNGMGRYVSPIIEQFVIKDMADVCMNREESIAQSKWEETHPLYPCIDQKGNSVPGYEGEAELVIEFWVTNMSGENGQWKEVAGDVSKQVHRCFYRVILPQVEEEKPGLNGWIDVKDRLPTHGDKVDFSINILCFFDNEMRYVLSFIKHEDNNGKFYLNVGSMVFEDMTEQVTHWQPLPEPPTL